jgi:RNA polymerase sigma-70 factor (ECF subfamily)
MARLTDISIPQEVLERARDGEHGALEALYRAYSSATYTLIRRLVRRPAVAEELLQETFIEVIRHIGGYEGRAPLGAWIRAIAVNRGLMYLRSPWHRSLEWFDEQGVGADALPSPAGDPSAEVASRLDLEAALVRLPALTRAVVWLHDVEGYSHEEIAGMLGRTVSFSKSQLSRAHARLRDTIDTPRVGTCASVTTIT